MQSRGCRVLDDGARDGKFVGGGAVGGGGLGDEGLEDGVLRSPSILEKDGGAGGRREGRLTEIRMWE